jgi:hypothetical protein
MMTLHEVEPVTDEAAQQLVRARKLGELQREFWRTNFKRLAGEYPAQYVAVYQGEVVVHSPSLHALLGELRGRRIAPGEAFIEYMAVNPASIMPH